MKTLASFVCGEWIQGETPLAPLVNPTTEEVIAECSTNAIDFAATIEYARTHGGPSLRRLSFADRGTLLRRMAKVIHSARDELIGLAIANGGNTRKDAKFDIDGASATLAAYADLGQQLGDQHILADGEDVQLGRTARMSGQHIVVPRAGVAVHINAFNFPAWGLAEKAACALLAGMPVVSKPASATALVAFDMMQRFESEGILPTGALSFVCGSAGTLLDHLSGQDVLAFTGSGVTAETLRAGRGILTHSTHINVEADSLNAAVLGTDVEPGSETEQLFIADVLRDMTQKAGQKCTAIRRIFVPNAQVERIAALLQEDLAEITVGDPSQSSTRMGPLATEAQKRDVMQGIQRLAAHTTELYGGAGDIKATESGKGFFVGPVLRLASQPHQAPSVHNHEVFGPVATLAPYNDPADAATLVQLGQGGLVCSVYSDDRAFIRDMVLPIAAYHGRIYLGSRKIAAQAPGPGTVLPQLIHGGPGRAGGGEELGGLRGLSLYQQRTALEGDQALIRSVMGRT